MGWQCFFIFFPPEAGKSTKGHGNLGEFETECSVNSDKNSTTREWICHDANERGKGCVCGDGHEIRT